MVSGQNNVGSGERFRARVRTIAAVADRPERPGGGRIALLDAVRGVAILAMVAYHIGWNAYYLGLIATDITQDPVWVTFQRSIVTAFLLLVGIGLTLAHGDGIRWRPFWRRFAVIAGAALLTSIGTYVVFPDYWAYFGILHAIAAFSLIGLAFVRAPVWLTALAIAALMLPPLFVSDPVMSSKALSWIGFWPTPPMTTDIVPVFPWLGVVLIGIAGTRLMLRAGVRAGISRWRLDGPAGRVLRWLGRWSLVIYLVHQPVIFGAMNLLAPPQLAPDPVAFVQSCEQSCRDAPRQAGDEDAAARAAYCARYCLCAVEQVEQQSLWAEVATAPPTPAVDAMMRLCSAMAAD